MYLVVVRGLGCAQPVAAGRVSRRRHPPLSRRWAADYAAL